MKVAIIGHKRIPSSEGGIEKGVEQHAVRMAALGHEVHVYNRGGHHTFGAQFDAPRTSEYRGVHIHTIPTLPGALSVPVYSFLATICAILGGYDVVSYRASGPCVMVGLARLFGVRCVASLHGIDSLRDKWKGFSARYLEWGERTAARRANACLVLSRNMQRYIRERYDEPSIVFTNGIDRPERLPAREICERFGLETDGYVLSLGRIEPEKGLHHLIRAFRACRTGKKLVIAGGLDAARRYDRELLALAAGDDRIVFTGHVVGSTVAELYSNASLFVLPSHLEGMSNALLEAMSYGNCCLVSDIPENTEVVEDKAVRFRSHDEDDLREKLQALLDSPRLVERYRRAAAPYILSRYSWDAVVEQLLGIYADVAAGEAPRALPALAVEWKEAHI